MEDSLTSNYPLYCPTINKKSLYTWRGWSLKALTKLRLAERALYSIILLEKKNLKWSPYLKTFPIRIINIIPTPYL